MTISYVPGSIAGHFSKEEVRAMHDWISTDLPGFEFDPQYLDHIQMNNGGRPVQKYFVTAGGRCMPIDRFLNYSDVEFLEDRDTKLLNANVVWAMIEDRLNCYLLPFAELPNGDYLCFDYEFGFPPRVALWVNELSEEDSPYLEPVAANFSEFLSGLSATPL